MFIFFLTPIPLGLIRFQLHASVILSQDVKIFSILFAEIADAYFEKHLWADAKPIYELLGIDPEVCLCTTFYLNVLNSTV